MKFSVNGHFYDTEEIWNHNFSCEDYVHEYRCRGHLVMDTVELRGLEIKDKVIKHMMALVDISLLICGTIQHDPSSMRNSDALKFLLHERNMHLAELASCDADIVRYIQRSPIMSKVDEAMILLITSG